MDFVPDFQIAHIGVNLPDEICATQCAEPVSYTHLDVYKRQMNIRWKGFRA